MVGGEKMKALISSEFKRQSKGDKLFDVMNYTILTILLVIVLYPLIFIVVASVSEPDAVARGEVWLLPVGLNVDGYKEVLKNADIWKGYANTIKYTVTGTLMNVCLTIPAAYALSRKELVGRNFLMGMITFTMFFGGGLIPTYLLVSGLHLNNTMWALIIPGAISVYNLIISRSYFLSNIPEELFEAGQMDGCSYFKFFFSVVLPLAKPILGVIVLMYAVGHWNSYFNALIYLRDRQLYPLQVILREMLIQQEASMSMGGSAASVMEQQRIADMLKYGVIIVSTLPILCVYPFIQKYFVKGMMIGSVKG